MGPVKASPQTQLRLLELADLDTDLARLETIARWGALRLRLLVHPWELTE